MHILAAFAALFYAVFPKTTQEVAARAVTTVKGAFGSYGPQLPPVDPHSLDVLARTLWGEARGEGRVGMQAVANVIMNRYELAVKSTARARQFGSTVAGICQKKWQFSCWLPSDPNRAKMLSVTDADPQFKQAKEIATLALQGALADITGGADHYHTFAVSPAWSQGATAIASHGSHLFFKLA